METALKSTPLRVGATAVYPYSEQMHQAMFRMSRFEEPVNLAEADDNFLYVPRQFVPDAEYLDCRSWGEKIDIAVNCKYGPRNEDQKRVVEESIALLRGGNSFLVEASTGFGKTYVGCMMTVDTAVKTLIVVTKEDSRDGWKNDFKKFTDLTDADIGFIQGTKTQVAGKKVCIGMVQTLYKGKLPDWVYHEFGLIIFDEVHHMAADKFSRVCFRFSARLRVGLSATPRRTDGKEFVFESHIGPVGVVAKLIPLRPRIIFVKSEWRLPRKKDEVTGEEKPMAHSPGKLGHVMKMLAGNKKRNDLIVQFIKACYDRGRYVVGLSDLGVDLYLGRMRQMLVEAGIPSKDISYYVSGLSKEERYKAVAKRVTLATYGMAAEATDVPWWSAGVMMTPRSNVEQPLGRILREYPDKPEPVWFDIMDEDSWVFRRYHKKRMQVYRQPEINAIIDQV